MSNNSAPDILRQELRNPQGLVPLGEDVRDDEKEAKKILEAKVVEVVEPVAVTVAWEGPEDPENPQNFSTTKKWCITVVCCVLTINSYVHFLLHGAAVLTLFSRQPKQMGGHC